MTNRAFCGLAWGSRFYPRVAGFVEVQPVNKANRVMLRKTSCFVYNPAIPVLACMFQ